MRLMILLIPFDEEKVSFLLRLTLFQSASQTHCFCINWLLSLICLHGPLFLLTLKLRYLT